MKILKCRLSKKCLSAPDITGDFCKSLSVRITYCQGFLCQKRPFFTLIRQNTYKLQKWSVTYVFCAFPVRITQDTGCFCALQKWSVTYVFCAFPVRITLEYRPLLQDTKTVGTLCNSNGERENPQVTGHFCNSLAVRITYYQGILGPQTSLPVRINTNSKAQIHRLPTVLHFVCILTGNPPIPVRTLY